MEYNLKEIGKRIKKERRAAGFKSQSALAEKMNYSLDSRQTIGKWENGKVMPGLDEMLRMCAIFHCELGYLLCEYDCKTREKTDIHAVTGLSEKSIDTLKAISNGQSIWIGGRSGVVKEDNEWIYKVISPLIINFIFEDIHFWNEFDGLLSNYLNANDKNTEVQSPEISDSNAARYALSRLSENLIDDILKPYESKSIPKPKKLFELPEQKKNGQAF